MKSVLSFSILCIALGACTAEVPRTEASAAVAAQTDARAATSPASAPQAEPVAAEPSTHRFAFAERGKTPGASAVSIVGAEPTPCGPVLIARVATIPLEDARVLPDWVVEFDASGKQVRKWGVPYEALVVAIDGQRLQFRTDTGTYWTDAAGAVEQADANGLGAGVERPASLVDAGTALECPAGIAGPDAEVQCATVRDAAGQERRLAVETVCS